MLIKDPHTDPQVKIISAERKKRGKKRNMSVASIDCRCEDTKKR
jgi:hypothetical protein